MKISKIYCNKEELFQTIKFTNFNVIFGDVKKPKNTEKDSHNLGKTLLISLIDFLMLKKLTQEHFLKKHYERFKDFEFYLEIELNSGKFITIKRCVKENTIIYFKKHNDKDKDFTKLSESKWEKVNLEKARNLLDSYLNLLSLGNWPYRKAISYFLREQKDYLDVFQIGKFGSGLHEYWKPFIAKMLGFNEKNIQMKYELDKKIDDSNNKLDEIKNKVSIKNEEYDKLKGIIQIKKHEIKNMENEIEKFNFYNEEIKFNKKLVEDIESKISELNNKLYNINYKIEKIQESLSNNVKFNLKEIKKIFEESNIYFSENLVKSYEDVVLFNKKIYKERRKYLKEILLKNENEREILLKELKEKNQNRSDILNFIRNEETFKKFKEIQKNLVSEKTNLNELKNQLEKLNLITDLEKKIKLMIDERKKIINDIKKEIKTGNKIYKEIRISFNEIIKSVFNKTAIISLKLNKYGNLEFKAEIVKDEKTLELTSEAEGTSTKKILCAAFDLSLLRAYSKNSFFRFVYHDGILEGLDDRKKIKFLEVVKKYVNEYRIQYILTLIKDDLPRDLNGKVIPFKDEEIILRLTDEGDRGRLFKMPKF